MARPFTSSLLDPRRTPLSLKIFLTIFTAVNILCSFFPTLIFHLTLTWQGMEHFFWWQPLTYLFILPSAYPFSFSFIINLFFYLYFLWIIGMALIDEIGPISFFTLYFSCGIISGLFGILLLALTKSLSVLLGPFPALYGAALVWTLFFYDLEFRLFFFLTLKAKWIITALVALCLLDQLIDGRFIEAAMLLFGLGYAYLYGVCAWGLKSPFAFTQRFDRFLSYTFDRFFRKRSTATSSKIIDITTGKTVRSDDVFLDEMLEKIGKHGEKSLTWREKRRLRNISRQKSKG